jgi:hypothetical protein
MKAKCDWPGCTKQPAIATAIGRVVVVKKLFLAGIAALSMLSASEAQPTTKAELPDSMVGLWCHAEDISTNNEDHYLEPYGADRDDFDCSEKGAFDRIEIWKEDGSSGYRFNWFLPGWHGVCTFEKIEVITPSVVLVHANCRSGLPSEHQSKIGQCCAPPYTENLELRLIGGALIITELPEG